MAKGRGDDCLQAGGGRTGVWVALEPPPAACGSSTRQPSPASAGANGLPQCRAAPQWGWLAF